MGSLEPLTEVFEGKVAGEGVSVLFLEAFFLLLALLEILAASLGEGVGGMICGEGQVSAAGPGKESVCPLSHQARDVVRMSTRAHVLRTRWMNWASCDLHGRK